MSVIDTKDSGRDDPITGVFPDWQIRVGPNPDLPPYFRWKVAVDRVLAGILLIPGLPAIAGLVALVRLTSRGPGIYRQTRIGKNGHVFRMYKIRTMARNAEAKTGPIWTRTKDPRITRIGRVLRKLHLDELPQLFNVIKGEMSLVGPRPERPEFVHVLASQIPGYLARLAVPPGVSGLAQINLPPDSDLESVRRKLALDLQYVDGANLLLDVRVLLCTGVRLLGVPGESAMRLFRLRREAPGLDAGARPGNGFAATPHSIAGQALQQSRDGNGKAREQGRPDDPTHPRPG